MDLKGRGKEEMVWKGIRRPEPREVIPPTYKPQNRLDGLPMLTDHGKGYVFSLVEATKVSFQQTELPHVKLNSCSQQESSIYFITTESSNVRLLITFIYSYHKQAGCGISN